MSGTRTKMQSACEEYLRSGDRDVLLVAVSKSLCSDGSERVASVLEGYGGVLSQLGWELLSMLSPHLNTSHYHTLQLCQHITEVCSAKEMCLAILEQMELSPKPAAVFLLLRILRTVLTRLKNERAVTSSVGSVTRIMQRHYLTLGVGEKGKGEEENKKEKCPEDVPVSDDSGSLPLISAADHALFFVEPLVEEIEGRQSQYLWSPRQRECLSFLLSLLDRPVVCHDLSVVRTTVRATAERIMELVVHCHCGCVQLLECEGGYSHEADQSTPIPPLGLACCAYLFLSEGVQLSYLPCVLHPLYLLQSSLHHSTLLLTYSGDTTEKGLALLEALLRRVARHTLPSMLLDNQSYMHLAEVLTDVMVTCPYRPLRRKSVPLLLQLINCFTDSGRHRMYRSLFHMVGHSGVLGLLTHSVKEEVDQALRSEVAGPFLGQELGPLLKLILRVSQDSDTLQDCDRVMASLNFLRYLLIRDNPSNNRTCVWSEVCQWRSKFTEPLRRALEVTRAHYRHQAEGNVLPDIPPQEQQRVLSVAQDQLDMMESVLTRVEELLDSASSRPDTCPG